MLCSSSIFTLHGWSLLNMLDFIIVGLRISLLMYFTLNDCIRHLAPQSLTCIEVLYSLQVAGLSVVSVLCFTSSALVALFTDIPVCSCLLFLQSVQFQFSYSSCKIYLFIFLLKFLIY